MASTRARSCGDKQKHNTIREARDHKWSLVREKGASPKLIRVYKCKYCKKYHIGRGRTRKR